jgi:hypothetical protein
VSVYLSDLFLKTRLLFRIYLIYTKSICCCYEKNKINGDIVLNENSKIDIYINSVSIHWKKHVSPPTTMKFICEFIRIIIGWRKKTCPGKVHVRNVFAVIKHLDCGKISSEGCEGLLTRLKVPAIVF